jgi:hypothetical protein
MGGLGVPGVYVGTDAFGGAWAFDPWELYARRIMHSPDVIVLGGISYAKSTLIKTRSNRSSGTTAPSSQSPQGSPMGLSAGAICGTPGAAASFDATPRRGIR